jgi:hypothetical protein
MYEVGYVRQYNVPPLSLHVTLFVEIVKSPSWCTPTVMGLVLSHVFPKLNKCFRDIGWCPRRCLWWCEASGVLSVVSLDGDSSRDCRRSEVLLPLWSPAAIMVAAPV